VPADAPTILATSGGVFPGRRTAWELAPLISFAVELSGVTGRAPRICYVGTAGGDQRYQAGVFGDAAQAAGMVANALHLFPMPNVERPVELLLEQDVVWVGGGSVANLIALWRLHGIDGAMRTAWESGVVLAGVSAGSICWHHGGTTDSFGPILRAVSGLGFLPYANGVHYDSEPQRRPFLQRLIGQGGLPTGYATDDGVGLYYRGTELIEAVSEIRQRGAYLIRREGDAAIEERIEPRLLPGAR
jgi:peptidase E